MSRSDYTHLAEEYDSKRFEDAKGQFLARIDAAILKKFMKIVCAERSNPQKVVLDMPVGTGRVLSYLGDELINVVGCDLTSSMLKIAQSKQRENCVGLVQGDGTRLPFEHNTFDCIVSLRFFHLFASEDRKIFIPELTRVLKPGGFILCSFTNGWYGFGLNWIRRLRGKFTVHFLANGEVPLLFPNYQVRQLHGNYLPLQSSLVAAFGKVVEEAGLAVTGSFPFNKVCFERYYLLQKL